MNSNKRRDRAREIFFAYLRCETPQERAQLVGRECAGDSELESAVINLIEVHESSGSFLEEPLGGPLAVRAAGGVSATIASPQVTEQAGSYIGPYKLLEQIGEGGMGVVYMAQQKEPVRRKVALKVIKPGMDTKQVVARFEAERQALALMDHPNIAKVHDAGATESGRPFFVMELVKGIPITEYCDQQRLSTSQRLELFIAVCGAVHHAHQKGIIHRDLKPSNVLVEQHDVTAVPKVIDFGVAKATNQELTERSLFTNFAQMVGTPLYMSPEQAELRGLDVDTRSDIYSLGVLLYEILCGTTPFDSQFMREASYDEIRQIIREHEPPKPSDRISTLNAEALSTISDRRGHDPRKLMRVIRGDLDWIVMKALEKDRTRRYESASAFAADVKRFLDDEPVLACPPSPGYKLRKLAQRNKAAFSTAILVTLALLLGIAGTSWQAIVAHEQRDHARRQQQAAQENFRRAREAVDTYLTKVSEDELLNAPGLQKLRQDLLELALKYYQQFVDEQEDAPDLQAEYANALDRVGDIRSTLGSPDEASKLHKQALEVRRKLVEKHPTDEELLHVLAESYILVGDISGIEKAIGIAEALQAPEHQATLAEALMHVGYWNFRKFRNEGGTEKMEAARKAYLRAIQILEDVQKQQPYLHADRLSMAYRMLADWHDTMGTEDRGAELLQKGLDVIERLANADPANVKYQENLQYAYWHAGEYRESLKITERLVAENPLVVKHRKTLADSYGTLSGIRLRQPGKKDEAIRWAEKSMAIYERLSQQYPDRKQHQGNLGIQRVALGNALLAAGNANEAIEAFEAGVDSLTESGLWRGQQADAYLYLSRALARCGRLDEAIEHQRSVVSLTKQLSPGQLHFRSTHATNLGELGDLLRDRGKLDEAKDAYQQAVDVLRQLFAGGPDGTPDQVRNARRWLIGAQSDLASILSELGQHDEAAEWSRRAIADMSEAIRLQPKVAENWRRRGHYYFELEKDGKALADLSQAILLNPTFGRAYKERSWVYHRMGKADLALEDAHVAIEQNPEQRYLYLERAGVHRSLEQFELALADCQHAIDLDPENDAKNFTRANAYVLRGDLYAENLQQHKQAIAEYSKAIDLEPHSAEYLEKRGKAFESIGEDGRAAADFDEAARFTNTEETPL